MTRSTFVTLIGMVFILQSCKKEIPADENKLVPGTNISDVNIFTADSLWNTDISGELPDPNSDNLIASIGLDTRLHPDFGTTWLGKPIGIPYNVVNGSQPKVKVSFHYSGESDPGPYPIPANVLIEAGSDKHVLIIDTENKILYELFNVTKSSNNIWSAGSGAIFNLSSNTLRPDYWTSADAAGLPILPGLVRYDEVVEKGAINHALRFTAARTRNAFVHPATHGASEESNTNLPPMGMRVRLKSSFDISPFSPNIQVILKALKKYGMFLADNGSNWYISGAPDPRWDDEELGELKTIEGSNFEVVKMGQVIPMND